MNASVLKYHSQSPIMPKATQKYACEKHNLLQRRVRNPKQPRRHIKLRSRKEQEPDPEFSFLPSKVQQPISNMFMPYTEGPKMEWTVNDAFY